MVDWIGLVGIGLDDASGMMRVKEGVDVIRYRYVQGAMRRWRRSMML